jgi:hypothetical protein
LSPDFFQIYYNFIRPSESLFGHTPAEIANVDLNLGDNKWENLLAKSLKNHNLPTPKHQH